MPIFKGKNNRGLNWNFSGACFCNGCTVGLKGRRKKFKKKTK